MQKPCRECVIGQKRAKVVYCFVRGHRNKVGVKTKTKKRKMERTEGKNGSYEHKI